MIHRNGLILIGFWMSVILLIAVVIINLDDTTNPEIKPPIPTASETTIKIATMTFPPTQITIPATATWVRIELPTVAVDNAGQYIVTYYDQCCAGGPYYCGTDIYGYFDPADPTTVATSLEGFPCGTRLIICNELCVIVIVKDKCAGCSNRQLDLSRGAWELLGMPSSVGVEIIE